MLLSGDNNNNIATTKPQIGQRHSPQQLLLDPLWQLLRNDTERRERYFENLETAPDLKGNLPADIQRQYDDFIVRRLSQQQHQEEETPPPQPEQLPIVLQRVFNVIRENGMDPCDVLNSEMQQKYDAYVRDESNVNKTK